MTRSEFISKYKKDVVDSVCGTGIFPSVKMAQMIIESADSFGNAGQGITFVRANNAFGIKQGVGWKGEVMTFSTPRDGKPVSVFRVYPTVKDSIIDHTRFLQVNSRYAKAGVFTAKTPEEQLEALQKAGYSESATYAQALSKMIEIYNLKELDKDCQKKK